MTAMLRIGLVVLVILAGCTAVWLYGADLLAWFGLAELDIPGRVVLVFCFLTACQLVLDRLHKPE